MNRVMIGHYRVVATLLLLLSLVACGSAGGSSDNNGKQNVVATTGQICDAVSRIAEDRVALECLFGPGVDPHLYVPTESDVNAFSEADIIFYNGLHLEAQMERILTQLASRGKRVVAIGDTLPEDRLLDWDQSAPFDPHVWNDPLLWSEGVRVIGETLSEADPANAESYQQQLEAYLAEIEETHEYAQEQISRIPEANRVMVTAHDAFGYFARTYGLEVQGLQGISTEAEASIADLQAVGDFIVERRIPALFIESSVSPRNIEALQEYVRSKGHDVAIGGTLYSDALGDPGTPEGTYTGMLRHNAETLAEALGG